MALHRPIAFLKGCQKAFYPPPLPTSYCHPPPSLLLGGGSSPPPPPPHSGAEPKVPKEKLAQSCREGGVQGGGLGPTPTPSGAELLKGAPPPHPNPQPPPPPATGCLPVPYLALCPTPNNLSNTQPPYRTLRSASFPILHRE